MKNTTSIINMTKKELLFYLKDKDDSFYEIFYKKPEQIKDHLFNSYESDLVIKTLEKNKPDINTIQLYAIKLEGEMFTYDIPLVPIHVYLHNQTTRNKKTKDYTDNLVITFYASTIDDASMCFRHNINNVKEYLQWLEKIKLWLNGFKAMPSIEDFQKYWLKEGVLISEFDYN